VAGDDGQILRPFGSAFLVAKGLAFTARHVIDEIFERFTGVRPDKALGDLDFGVQIGTGSPSPGKVFRWDVVDFHYSESIDICALSVEPADTGPTTWNLAEINVSPPLPGSSVMAFGYGNSEWSSSDDGEFQITLKPASAIGEVQEVHYHYRDRSMLKFPCFRTNARFDPGMSGGPVFDSAGHVRGIVCDSLAAQNDQEEHASYVSLIWPALGLRMNDRGRQRTSPRFLLDLGMANLLRVHNLSLVSVEARDDGDVLTMAGHGKPPG
jgi:S1-C subfamily serine protease